MYKKYKIKGLKEQDINSIVHYFNEHPSIIHCSIQYKSNLIFIDMKNKISLNELNTYIHKLSYKISLYEITYKKHHHNEPHQQCQCSSHQNKDERHLEKAHRFSICGLDCAHCAMKVENMIKNLTYVDDAVLNFTTLTLMVKSDESDLMKKLQNEINKIEHGVTLSKETNVSLEKPKLFDFKANKHIIFAFLLLIVSLLISSSMIQFLFILCAYFMVGYPVFYKAFKNMMKGQLFDENFLMCIATIGAFLIGEYFEAVAVMLFYSIGEMIQSYAVSKTRRSITQLMDIKSESAQVLDHGSIVVKDPNDVNIGDILVVKAGEKIPLDGVIVKGESSLDTSSLTGESLPRSVCVNDDVLAGMINLGEVLHIKATLPYKDSAVAKIIDLMENAASKKAPLEKFITRFARIYTPIVVIMALLLIVIPFIFIKDVNMYQWIYRSLTFLVVSCPCALVVSIPLGLYAGLGKASQYGALIKGGNYLEFLKDIDTVVFDKTGTLTKGTFKVIQVNGDQKMLEIAALVESMSNHPISKSIVSYYNNTLDYHRISHYKEIAGKGIECFIDNQHYYLGNKTYFNELGIDVDDVDMIGTVVYVALDHYCLGSIVVADEMKESSILGVHKLKNDLSLSTVMLTGDKNNVAHYIGKKLDIDYIYSELLPQDKVYKVETLLNNHHVMFVGDGINDAPVLSMAHIGVAMGGVGSDAAIEAADIVLMNDDIDILYHVIQLSKRVNIILKQNVVFILFIKLAVLLLTLFGYSNMWMGVFADVGVTLLAIINSMRILK